MPSSMPADTEVCKLRQAKAAHARFRVPTTAGPYNLDGTLKGVPGKAAFPDLDMAADGLVEVCAVEKGGLVYVMQQGEITDAMLEGAPDFFSRDQILFHQSATEDNANWKLLTETLLEGYHIKSLHRDSFYPFGLDNINVVETFGENSRIVYPFKRIEKLRAIKREQRRIAGSATLGLSLVSQRECCGAVKTHQRDHY